MDDETYTQRLVKMRSWPDNWNSYGALAPTPVAIDKALDWLTILQGALAPDDWHDPLFVTGSGDGGVCVEWRVSPRQLSLFFDGVTVDYLQVCGTHVGADMLDGEIADLAELLSLWSWLRDG